MPPNAPPGPDHSSDQRAKNTANAEDVRSEASRSSLGPYRAILPRPTLTDAHATHSSGKAPRKADQSTPDQRSPGHQRRSPRGPSVSSYLTGPSQTAESSRAVVSLRHAGSDPTPLPLPITNLLRRRRSGSENPNTYFPFRHSRKRNDARNESPPEPCLLGLPMETRYRIYRLLLVKDHVLEFTTMRYNPRLVIPPLLQVNQQIREESSHVWYGLNHFSLTIKHGETAILRTFLAAIASLPSPAMGNLEILLNTCFECNDLIAVAALLIAANMSARIKCVRGVFHFGHPKVEPCRLSIMQTINDQHFRPSVATALLQFSDQQRTGAGFVIEGECNSSLKSLEPLSRVTAADLYENCLGLCRTIASGLWSGRRRFHTKGLIHFRVYSYLSRQSFDTEALGECNGQRRPVAFMIYDWNDNRSWTKHWTPCCRLFPQQELDAGPAAK